jgi:hypothetical protein
MTNEILDSLVKSGEISSYVYEEILDAPDSDSRKTERVELTFSSGKKLVIDTFFVLVVWKIHLCFLGHQTKMDKFLGLGL